MKSATLFLVSILIFVFISPSLSTSILTADDDLVLDAAGNPLQKDVDYIISPPIWGPLGGSVKLSTPYGNNETCAADVIQDPFEVSIGTPFTFTPVNSSEDAIKFTSPFAIQSPSENPCGTSTVWQVTSRIGVYANIITTGGIINTGPSCLHISKPELQFTQYSYVIENCPNMCVAAAKICFPVGIYRSETTGLRHLSTSVEPFQFVFIKKSESAAKLSKI